MAEVTSSGQTVASEAWSLVGELWQEHRRRVATIASEYELSPPQVWALKAITPGEPVPMSALADHLRCDASNVTGIVDRLEHRGLVERRPADHDRRIKHLRLTPQGAALRDEVVARIEAPPGAIARLSAAEQRELVELLRRALR